MKKTVSVDESIYNFIKYIQETKHQRTIGDAVAWICAHDTEEFYCDFVKENKVKYDKSI